MMEHALAVWQAPGVLASRFAERYALGAVEQTPLPDLGTPGTFIPWPQSPTDPAVLLHANRRQRRCGSCAKRRAAFKREYCRECVAEHGEANLKVMLAAADPNKRQAP